MSALPRSEGVVRSCIGCRRRRPIEELLGIGHSRSDNREEAAWCVVKLAGRLVEHMPNAEPGRQPIQPHGQVEHGGLRNSAVTVAIDRSSLVIAGDVAEGVGDAGGAQTLHAVAGRTGKTGKGWYACPESRCLERALKAKSGAERGRAAKAGRAVKTGKADSKRATVEARTRATGDVRKTGKGIAGTAGKQRTGSSQPSKNRAERSVAMNQAGGQTGKDAGGGHSAIARERGAGKGATGNTGVGDAVIRVLHQAAGLAERCILARESGLRRRQVEVKGDAHLDAWQALAARLQAELAGGQRRG